MSFYHLPSPWDPGYAIPNYVMAEPPERGTFTTQWLPRGTIYPLVPDFLAKPGQKLLGRSDAGLGSLSGSTLAKSTLAKHTLSGCTLGDSVTPSYDPTKSSDVVYVAPTPPAPTTSPPPAAQSSTWDTAKPYVLVGGAAALAYFLLRKKKR